jgi:hypothetical protein
LSFFAANVERTDMADEKTAIDEDIAALIAEALISIESAEMGLDLIIAREGAQPHFIEAKTRLARAKEALRDLGTLTGGTNGQ